MSLRKFIAAFASMFLIASSVVLLPATSAQAEFKACEPTAGVGVVHPSFPSKPQPIDENVNVYVGGNFTRTLGAELEGQLVVNGNATLAGNAIYNIGRVGAGSGIVPISGQDIVRVGGNFTIDGSSKALVGSLSATNDVLPGNVKAGGTIATTAKIDLVIGGTATQSMGSAAALGPAFSAWPSNNFAVLSDFATRNVTGAAGTYAFSPGGYLDLNGTVGQTRHVFTIPGSAFTGQTIELRLNNINATDIIVVNVTGPTANLAVNGLYVGATQIGMGEVRFGQTASRTLWVFSDATDVTIGGMGQVPGSVVVPKAASTTKLTAPGSNGRIWVAGDLIHNANGGEFHAFPFLGDPDSTCGKPMVPVSDTTPTNPTVSQAVCVAGAPSTPSVTLPADTTSVHYTKSGAEVAGGTVTVTATAQSGFQFPVTVTGWTVSSNRLTATQTIVLSTPDCVATPVAPTVSQSVCLAGVPTTPSVTLPADTTRVHYTKSGAEVPGGTVTVTATAQGEYRFPAVVSGWTVSTDRLTATQTIVLSTPDCAAVPSTPTVNQSVCVAGAPSAPLVTLPADTARVHYTKSGSETPGGTVTVTATAQGEFRFSAGLLGWTVSTDGITATRTIVLSTPDCVATPIAPTVYQSVCVAGAPSTPSVTLPADTASVHYTKSGAEVPGGTVTVTATAQGAFRFPASVPGWTVSGDQITATQTIVLSTPDCAAVPSTPTVNQSVCLAGAPTTPSVTLPADTARVHYTKSGSETPGGTVTVTATAQGEYRFSAGLLGWTVSTDGITATRTIVLSTPDCAATPVTPTVSQSVCLAGAPTTPSVTLPADTATVHYTKSGAEVPGGAVTVTATAQGEYRFPVTVSGWTISGDQITATQDIVLDNPDCGATPVAPTVSQSVCVAGFPSTPSVTLPADTASVHYTKSGAEVPGGTVTVTATAQGEFRFPVTVSGWTVSSDRLTATQDIVLDGPDCGATPVAPTVSQSVCVAGFPSTPSVTLSADTATVHYTKSGSETPGSTVTVTATAQGEYRFPAVVSGWTISGDQITATQDIVLDNPDCAATPTAPTVSQSVCVAGAPTAPSVTLPVDTASVHYTKSGSEVPGGTVTVTATAQGEFRFPVTVSGWTISGDQITATQDILLDNPDCSANLTEPTVSQSVCLAGVPTTPSVTLPADTATVHYTKSGSEIPGGTVTVTATAQGEYRFPATVTGWTVSTDRLTATQTIVLSTPDCAAVPSTPTVNQSVCVAGAPSAPLVTLPADTARVHYTKSGAEVAGGTVTVTATAQGEYRFSAGLLGWTVSTDGITATRTIVLSTPDCVATPVAPTVSQSVCVAGAPSTPSVTLPADTTRVHYSKSGAEVPGGTVTVTATAQGEFRFPAVVSGWTVSGDQLTATQDILLDNPDCSANLTEPTVSQSVCLAGAPTTPSVTLPADTATVHYTKSGAEVQGGTVTVTATAQGAFRFPAAVSGWTVSTDRLTATQTIVLSTPDCVATPVTPTVSQSVCLAGAPTTPSVTLPADTATVHYTKSGAEVPGGAVTVTATAQGEYRFPVTVSGWTISGDQITATQDILLDNPDCSANLTEPTVSQSVCLAGAPTTPSVTLPADTTRVHYTKSGAEVPGGTVTVTATAQGEYRFPATVTGWTVSTDRLTATQTIVLSTPDCAAVPSTPTVNQSVCVAGAPSAPLVTLPADTARVHYTKSGAEVAGGTVTVTATAQGEYRFSAGLLGWTVSTDGLTATRTIVLDNPDCAATPVAPTVSQSVCVAGAPTTPSVTLPADTATVHYTKSGLETPGGTVTVTATAQGEFRFPATVTDWTVSSDGITATQDILLDNPDCSANLTEPTVSQSVCLAGAPTTPSVTLPADTATVHYTKSGAEVPGGTVTVTATAQGAFRFPASVPGWTVSGDQITATQDIVLDNPDCAATPTAPTVSQSVCLAGAPTTPSVTLPADTASVHYTKSGSEVPGGTVTVTATAQGEYRFPAIVTGWTVSSDRLTATQDIVLDSPDCEVTPVAPTVSQSVCVAGAPTTPSVTLPADTASVHYTKSGSEVPGGTVTVTATAQGALRFPASVPGWTVSSDQLTATQDILLDNPDCSANLTEPTVSQSVCVAGAASTPSVTLPADTGFVHYTKSGAEVPGGTVTVTATAQGGFRFPATVTGWTVSTDRLTATQTVVLTTPDCAASVTEPTVSQSVCVAGAPTTPSVTLPADTTRVHYTKSGSETPGGTVTVTATAQGEFRFPATITGWTVSTDRVTATMDIVLDSPDCVTQVLGAVTPTFSTSVCVSGVPSEPTLIFDTTTGVTYAITAGIPTPGNTVTVTATASPGFSLSASPGWTVAPDGLTATMSLVIPPADGCSPVLADPGISQATCSAGASITLPTTVGIVYSTSNPNPAPGETVTITATPLSGYVLSAAPHWSLKSNGTATFTVALTKPICVGDTDISGVLANTGAVPVPLWVSGGALAALIAGAVLLIARRRPRESTES